MFEDEEREVFRMFMRMVENFSGCRVLSYCVISNHFHILLEVVSMPKDGITDAELLRRLGVFYGAVIGNRGFVNDVFSASRDRFSEKSEDGARAMKGSTKEAVGVLWSVRTLRIGVG